MEYLKTITFGALLFLGTNLQADENPEGFDWRINVEIYSPKPEIREELERINTCQENTESFEEYVASLAVALEAVAKTLEYESGKAKVSFHVRDEPLSED